MGSFVSKGTVKVTVPEREGEWIEIKAALSVKEQNMLQNALLVIRGEKDETMERMIHLGSYHQTLLEAVVVGWHLLDDEGQPVPFKARLIGELDPDDPLVDKTLGEIAERFPLGGKKKSED